MADLPGTVHTTRDAAWSVAEHGCQVLGWQPGSQPVIWFDAAHAEEKDRVIRGGVPLCAPWFGHGPDDDLDPQHGLARLTDFDVVADAGSDRLEVTGAALLDGIEVRHHVVMDAEALTMTLLLTNRDATPRVVEAMWHTYLRVGDAARTSVEGVRGADWHNFATGTTGHFDDNALPLTPDTDTVLQGVGTTLTLVDPTWNRHIDLTLGGCRSAVVWNPHSATKVRPGPTGEAWRDFVCVETGLCKDNAVTLDPGRDLSLTTRLTVREG